MFGFTLEKKDSNTLARVGTIVTDHGVIETPAFVVVGTKATVKAIPPEQVRNLGAQVVLANTYHLYLEPGEKIVRQAGGLHKFMNWNGPTMTDSGGFQVFSLGKAFAKGVSKVAKGETQEQEEEEGLESKPKLAHIDEDGVTFRSHLDGSEHRLTPEKSIQIQHDIGADIIFAFDECTSPTDSKEYQTEALTRTHSWAKRSLSEHARLEGSQALFGIVQGGKYEDLRRESAKAIGAMDFDGFGIGGSFSKEDIGTAVRWVNEELPDNKPRHLLGIGEPEDLFAAVENGCDTFDCVSPTRRARNGSLYTASGLINITNSNFQSDFTPIDTLCLCYTCAHYTRAYLAHLFRSHELLAYELASIHNVHFITNLVKGMRNALIKGLFSDYKNEFLGRYYSR